MPPQAARILLTRPADQGAAFASELRADFGARIEIVESPLLEICPVTPDLPPGRFAAVALTSVNALPTAVALRDRLPRRVFAVGDRTAEAARAAGFDAMSAAGNADDLTAMLVAADPGPVLHLHGTETRGDVVPRLVAAGITAAGVIAYEQVEMPLNAAARQWLAEPRPVLVPLFSPRTASLFSQAARQAAAPLAIVSISPAVDRAATCRTAWRRIALRPDGAHVKQELSILLDSPSGT